MKKTVKRNIQFCILGVMFLLTSVNVLAQPAVIEPGNKSINTALINTGNFTWGSPKYRGVRSFATTFDDHKSSVSVQRNNREITFEQIHVKDGFETRRYTLVLNAKTLETISERFTNEDRTVSLQYTGSRAKGTQTVFKTNTKQNVDETIEGKHFHSASLPFVVSSLPLSLEYRAAFRAMRLGEGFKPEYYIYRITDIKEEQDYFSCVSGNHGVWEVTLEAKTRNHKMILWIDKSTRRIMRSEESFDGLHLLSNVFTEYDKETDVNPIKAPFNANEAEAMIGPGSSTIKGQASTKRYDDRRIFNKTEYAKKGSIVTLIPNTAYYREWLNYRVELTKANPYATGCLYPLPSEVMDKTLSTDVIDNKGSFVFQNLKPGEYFLLITFEATKYSRTTRTPNGTYTITVNSDGSGSVRQNVSERQLFSEKKVTNFQLVKISQAGETVSVKLNN